MILRSLLNRDPKWQSADPAERAAAAAQLQPSSPELQSLATTDPDAGVRAAALARTSDLATLKARIEAETDSGAKAAAQQRTVALLAGKSAEPLPVGERQSALDTGWPDDVLERVAVASRVERERIGQEAVATVRV